jgi:hypothetical protein
VPTKQWEERAPPLAVQRRRASAKASGHTGEFFLLLQTANPHRKSHHDADGTGDRGEIRQHSVDPASSGLWRVVTSEFIAFGPSPFSIYSVSLVLVLHFLSLFLISVISIH